MQCMFCISSSLPFLYHNVKALFSVFQNKKYPQQTYISKEGTQSNTRVTAAHPWGGGGAASPTTHSQGAPGLFSAGPEDRTLSLSR